MTLQQIKKTRYFLSLIDSINGVAGMQNYVGQMKAFYGDKFNLHLHISKYGITKTYTAEHSTNDKSAIKGFLDARLSEENNLDVICKILDLIEEGERSEDEKEFYSFIKKIYFSYSGKIELDQTIQIIATAPQEMLRIGDYPITRETVLGLIEKLRIYANELCMMHEVDTSVRNKQEINFQPQISVDAHNETKIELSAIFDNARQQANDEGLADKQLQIILEKLSELEELSKSKENKGKRWTKVKEIMKWLVEQGIQVAGILLPVLAQVIK